MLSRIVPVLALLVLLGGCTTKSPQLVDLPVELAINGPVGVDVESFGGNVIVTSGSRTSGVSVQVVRRAVFGKGREYEAERALDDIAVDVEVVPGDFGPIVQVRTTTTNPEPYFLRADVYIDGPDIDGVRAHTDRGSVLGTAIRGKVDIRARGGEVRVMTERPMLEPVTIVNDEGDIDYRIRAESTADFDCRCLRGRVHNRAERGRLNIHVGTNDRALRATLNDGTNPVVLRAADGDIRVAVVSDPLAVGQWIKF